jgi:hypothetical protein
MMQQIFIDNEYQYDYLQEGESHKLLYSNTDEWNSHVRGRVAFELIDDGNGLKISTDFNKEHIDYSHAEQLLILLKLTHGDVKIEIASKTTLL